MRDDDRDIIDPTPEELDSEFAEVCQHDARADDAIDNGPRVEPIDAARGA